MNKQREVIYAKRRAILEGEDISPLILDDIGELVDQATGVYMPKKGDPDPAAMQSFSDWLRTIFGLTIDPHEIEKRLADDVRVMLKARLAETYREREKTFGDAQMREMERTVSLSIIDTEWKNHLYSMDRLKEGIGMAAYGQKDPLVEYKREGFQMFAAMDLAIKQKALEVLFHIRAIHAPEEARRPFAYEGREERPAVSAPPPPPMAVPQSPAPGVMDALPPGIPPGMGMSMEQLQAVGGDEGPKVPVRREHPKVGRNDPCPCGSGKKYKKCHGAGAQ
jgi:preprotein translocase subunit SecA